MTKVVRLALISKTQKDGKEIPYKQICKVLWDLQKITRELKNKTVRFCWEWSGFSDDFKEKMGERPKEKECLLKCDGETGEVVKGYTIDGYLYDKFKDEILHTSNISTCIRETVALYKKDLKEVLKGERSIRTYKSNQPLDLHNGTIHLEYDNDSEKFSVKLSLLNKMGKEKYDIKTPFLFEIVVRDKSSKTILERCIDGEYKVRGSKLIYNEKKGQWFLNMSYSFEGKKRGLDKDRILGIDLGIVCPIVASVKGDKARFSVKGGEVEQFRRKLDARKRSVHKQRPNCGDGSIGHGYNTRMKPALLLSDKVARFRETYNYKVSKAVVAYAVKNNCGTIQMEELKGATKDKKGKEAFLKNWSYYDLQKKIEHKAEENDIDVVYIKPEYTSQRCSKCGAIHKESRPEQAKFICVECGFEENADYNASQNIAIKDIDKIIEQ